MKLTRLFTDVLTLRRRQPRLPKQIS